MEYRALEISRGPAALRVLLNRPEQGNGINATLLRELHAVLDTAESDPTVRMVVLEAAGPVFCSGMDFADVAGGQERGARDGEQAAEGGRAFYGLLRRFTTTRRIIVSVVDGRVTGGGVGLVAAGDFVYASERSSFALPEALWGLLPCSVAPFLVRRVGFQPAYAMTLSTLPVMAARAAGTGLVDEVTDDPEPSLRRLASRLTKIDDGVIGDGKRYFGRLWPVVEESEETAVEEFARLMASPAVRDRIAGFARHRRMPWESPG